jgi:DNA polymerase-3 subunit delta'
MNPITHAEKTPAEILLRSVEHNRVHSAYLLTGVGDAPMTAAAAFARALVCRQTRDSACEDCEACHRSRSTDAEGKEKPPITLDGKGKRGPTYRHMGDHPDLFWVERGADDSRITIRQIRDLQNGLRLGANEGGRRASIIAEAQWLSSNAQNGLLRLLEEPPPETTLILVASHASAVIATIRSRCVRVRFPSETDASIRDDDAPDSVSRIVETLDGLGQQSIPSILDFAEQYRGGRSVAAEAVTELIDVSAQWLAEEIRSAVARGERPATRELDAHHSLQRLRRDLISHNANPQMIAERLLLGLKDVVAS